MKKLLLFVVLTSGAALAQTDNTFSVKAFPGLDVGAKTTAAQAACNANTLIPCVIVFDPSLAVYPAGVTPPKCAQCIWVDWRTGGMSGAASVVLADSFPGADFCVKLRAANIWALANGYGMVDATHFSSPVTCSLDPVVSLAAPGANVNIVDMLPASWIKTTAAWTINNSGLSLEGRGPGKTVLAYVGVPLVSAVLTLGGSNNLFAVVNNQITGLSIIGHLANATDGIYASTAHHWKLSDVGIWGATGCGIHTAFAVTPSLSRPRINGTDASFYGYATGYSVPVSGLCFDSNAGGLTTDGTVTDADVSGVSSWGIDLAHANSMTFTSGTSEGNGSGLRVQKGSAYNTFIGLDTEGNASTDVLDNGTSTHLINIIAISNASSVTFGPTSRNAVLDGGLVTGYSADAAAQSAHRIVGNQILDSHPWTVRHNSGAMGWNAAGATGEVDYFLDNFNAAGLWAHLFWGANSANTGFQKLGGFYQGGDFEVITGVYKRAGVAGYTGTKTAGTCVFTISGGIITNVTGC